MKKIDEFKTTTNRSIYNRCKVYVEYQFTCIICFRRSGGSRYAGCQRWNRPTQRNWKKFRKTQYKN